MHIILLEFEEIKKQLKWVLIAYAGVNETQAFNLEIMMQFVIILFISYPCKLQQLRPRVPRYCLVMPSLSINIKTERRSQTKKIIN